MERRQALKVSCALCAGLVTRPLFPSSSPRYSPPARLHRPDAGSEEGGLWALMDRQERQIKRSGLLVPDETITRYAQAIACRLGGEHCPDIRVYVVRTPHFNATMAPNGLMQIWTGLLLRVSNEAQLAAVIGHELGHYYQRHSLQRLRDTKDKAFAAQIMGMFGVAGALGQLAVSASMFSFSREHESEADEIGAVLMHKSGYDVEESAKVWEGLLEEMRARDENKAWLGNSIFDSHPPSAERRDRLLGISSQLRGGVKGIDNFSKYTSLHIEGWCDDELKRRQFDESISLFSRLSKTTVNKTLMSYFLFESHRLRALPGDDALALQGFSSLSASMPNFARVYRSIGLIQRQRRQKDAAISAFTRYVELAPDAPDYELIDMYIKELKA